MTIGINEDESYYEFHFDSQDAIQGSNVGVTFVNGVPVQSRTTDWPLFTLGQPLSNITSVKILEVQIPYSFYTITPENASFTFEESDGGGPNTITIPTGNYTVTTICSALVTILNDRSVINGNNHTYTVTYSSANQTLLFTSNSAGVTSFTFTFGTSTDSGITNPRVVLGFNGGLISSSTAIHPVLSAPNVGAITGPNYLFINSDTLGRLVNCVLPNGLGQLQNGGVGPQLTKIPITVNPNGIIYWQEASGSPFFDLKQLSNITQIDFYLTLGNSRAQKPLRLNGLGFSIKLGFTTQSPHTSRTSGFVTMTGSGELAKALPSIPKKRVYE